jgi:hypothetical protein
MSIPGKCVLPGRGSILEGLAGAGTSDTQLESSLHDFRQQAEESGCMLEAHMPASAQMSASLWKIRGSVSKSLSEHGAPNSCHAWMHHAVHNALAGLLAVGVAGIAHSRQTRVSIAQ